MEYIYAALLLHKLGKEITEEHMKKVITAAGAQTDENRVKVVVTSLKGVNIDEQLANAAMAAAPVAATEVKEEKKKEEPKEEAAEGLASLFG